MLLCKLNRQEIFFSLITTLQRQFKAPANTANTRHFTPISHTSWLEYMLVEATPVNQEKMPL